MHTAKPIPLLLLNKTEKEDLLLLHFTQKKMSRQFVSLLLLLLVAVIAASVGVCGPLSDLSAFGYDPAADPAAIIVVGNARFTVLTPWVIRMEYARNGKFEDRATIVAVNRKLPVPPFTVNQTSRILSLRTEAVTVKYLLGYAFASDTLSASTTAGAQWKYGDVDHANLLGTFRSLDMICSLTLNCTQNKNVSVYGESLHCAWGVVSRGGWTTINDTNNFVMESSPGLWFSNDGRSTDDVDVYFFGHGNKYRQALYDFTRIAGKVPMMNKALLGSWWTRWFDFDQASIDHLMENFKTLSIPLDVLVLDMNWHTKQSWSGYTWDRQLFPYPDDALESIRNNGLFVSANLHDAEGIAPYEATYVQMCSAMGQDPAAQMPVPFQPLNATYMRAVDDIALNATGFDFYWIDWQQGGTKGGCSGGRMNPTLITNHVRGTTHMRRRENERDQILARFGGLGSHRYPVGFSGDVGLNVLGLSWECFAFQPYFSATASNVAYGYVSHDLVGPRFDHELHVRWMQFGAFSGVMRIHDRGLSAGVCEWLDLCAIVNIWRLPNRYFEAIRDAMQMRNSLLPYMYTALRAAFDTGVSMVHPMYYDYPDDDGAYLMGPDGVHAQYMFGDDIVVAPICTKANSTTEMATKEVWLPPGVWFDCVYGMLVEGNGSIVRRNYALEEIPIFVRAGAIITRVRYPAQMGIASAQWAQIDLSIYPGGQGARSIQMYEDDGTTLDYLHDDGQSSYTNIWYSKSAHNSMKVFVGANPDTPVGARAWRVLLHNSMPIQSATVNGIAIPYRKFADKSPSWTYDGQRSILVVSLGAFLKSTNITLDITFAASEDHSSLFSRASLFASRLQIAKRMLDEVRETPFSNSFGPGMMKTAASYGAALTHHVAATDIDAFLGLLANYTAATRAALAEISSHTDTTLAKAQALLLSALDDQ